MLGLEQTAMKHPSKVTHVLGVVQQAVKANADALEDLVSCGGSVIPCTFNKQCFLNSQFGVLIMH